MHPAAAEAKRIIGSIGMDYVIRVGTTKDIGNARDAALKSALFWLMALGDLIMAFYKHGRVIVLYQLIFNCPPW